jgi:hypothetical protein
MALLALTGPALFPYFVCGLLKISSFKSTYSETLPPPEQDAEEKPASRLLKNAQTQGASFDKLRTDSPDE